MKLELKHIAGYLPYGLKVMSQYNEVSDIDYINWSLDGHLRSGLNLRVEVIPSRFRGANLEHIKPILRPLSDLTRKELELEGFDSYIDYLTYENKGSQWTLKAPFNMVQYLLSQHFDIYGLIQNGLAIDKNTIL